jgi:hypothetical protein
VERGLTTDEKFDWVAASRWSAGPAEAGDTTPKKPQIVEATTTAFAHLITPYHGLTN